MMEVAIVQYSPIWGQVDENLQHVEKIVEGLVSGTELVIFPETFTTGFHPEPENIANIDFQYALEFLKRLSQKTGIAIMGSIASRRDERYFNTFLLISGMYHQSYDKVHLFSFGREREAFTQGDGPRIFDFQGQKMRPLICYDLRFPYISFEPEPFDLIVYVASWPAPRIHHWQQLLIARAIENQCYTIGVNRTGTDGLGLSYPGSSMAISYDGSIINDAEDTAISYIRLDFEAQKHYRSRLPFHTDRIHSYTLR